MHASSTLGVLRVSSAQRKLECTLVFAKVALLWDRLLKVLTPLMVSNL